MYFDSQHSVSFSFYCLSMFLNFRCLFLNLDAHLLSKIVQLTAVPITTSADLKHRQERANAFCEAIRALDATGFLHDIY